MRDPKPANSTWAVASHPSPAFEAMRRPRPPVEDDDDILTAKRSYVPMDAHQQDTGAPLLPATATGEPGTGTPAVDAQWFQALNEVLMEAVESQQPQSVSILVDRGANVNFADPLTGETPLLVAMDNEYWSMMELLLFRGADPNFVDPLTGNTPLMVAIYERNWTAAALLVAHGADEDLANPRDGQTAWLIAQHQGDAAVLSGMLMRRLSQYEDSHSGDGAAAARPGPAPVDDQQDACALPGAVTCCDTDGSIIHPATLETPAEIHPTASCGPVNNISAETDPTGLVSPSMLAVLSGPWHTD